jgi:pimeloyl-ACP methyl ester carboxylesterase
MGARVRVTLVCALVAACSSRSQPPAGNISYTDFYARYGYTRAQTTPAPTQQSEAKPEEAPRFDENGAHRDFPYAPSVRAMRDLFRNRALAERTPKAPAEVRRAIVDTFGVDLLGTGLEPVGSVTISDSTERFDFRFGDGGFGQAMIGRPNAPNGVLLVAIHGCSLSPDPILSNAASYANSLGLRALERGYTVVAPYVISQCGWIHNLDYAGSLSGLSVFGYELVKIRELTKWARREFGLRRVVVWGISLGAQYAMLLSSAFPDLYDITVISGGAGDYERSYLQRFDEVGLDASAPIGANTQVRLASRCSRLDVLASILPRKIVFEVSNNDINDGAMKMITAVEALAKRRSARIEVVVFEGLHETSPDQTLNVIARSLPGAGIRSSQRDGG